MNSLVRVNSLNCQKAGNLEEEYEDAYAVGAENLNFALADGATDSVYTKQWARLLVDQFVRDPFDPFTVETINEWLKPLQEEWNSVIPWDNLSWNVKAKARMGAFSTFLGLRIFIQNDTYIIDSVSVGDSCIFILSEQGPQTSFPITRTVEFDNNPHLLSSSQRNNANLCKYMKTFTRVVSDNNSIIMATDAFAKWFLNQLTIGNNMYEQFFDMNQNNFCELIDSLRSTKAIRNDDSTLLCISFR